MAYSKELRESVMSMIYSPDGPSLRKIESQYGVPKSTIQNWVKDAQKEVSTMKKKTHHRGYRPASEKLEAIIKSLTLDQEAFGLYLRANGLYSNIVNDWKQGALDALAGTKKKKAPQELVSSEIKKLKHELQTKEKALAELSAILILKKKTNLLLGIDDEDKKLISEPDNKS